MSVLATKTMDATAQGEEKVPYGFGIFLMVGLLVLALALVPRIFRVNESMQTGKLAPDFKFDFVVNTPAAPKDTLSQYKGNAVILDFWATWCGPCQMQSPVLDSVARRYSDRGLVVLGINTSDEPGNAQEWSARHRVSYPIAFDAGEAARLYGVTNLPTLIVLSRDGRIMAVRHGFTDASELESLVKRVL